MRIAIITPSTLRARSGNRNTAARWRSLLQTLGHRVTVEQHWSGHDADLMIALHARRSFASISRYSERFPTRPLIVALTGTDIYRDIESDANARLALDLATRLVVLQDMAPKALCREHRAKTHVVYQSARAIPRPPPLASCFEIVVSGHLRAEKDPFRTPAALRLLPADSRIRVTHVGAALTPEMASQARQWMQREPRYHWLGEVPHWKALRYLARSRAMVISSRMEGGANVVSEALCVGVPVVASRIAGNLGMLGLRYPGYYEACDERALARVLSRAERDATYYASLQKACAARAALVSPERERSALEKLIADSTRAAHPRTPSRRSDRARARIDFD